MAKEPSLFFWSMGDAAGIPPAPKPRKQRNSGLDFPNSPTMQVAQKKADEDCDQKRRDDFNRHMDVIDKGLDVMAGSKGRQF